MNREQYLAKRFWLAGIAPDADCHGAAVGQCIHDEPSPHPTDSSARSLAEQYRRLCAGHARLHRDTMK